MIPQIVLDPGVRIDDAWAARIADGFIASLKHSQTEIMSRIGDALSAIPLWDASQRVVSRCGDGIVKALGASCLGYNLAYKKKGRWNLLLITVFPRSDGRLVIETVGIDGRAVEIEALRRGRLMRQRTIQAPRVTDLLELSRHAFERFIQRAGLHKPGDVTRIFRDPENLYVLSCLALLEETGEVRMPINTPLGRCALVVVRDEPFGVLTATTLLSPPFTERQEAELDALKARLMAQ
jgi:hypothetical protein